MLLTYCRDEAGQERLYLLPKGTVDVWLEPVGCDGRWAYHCQQAETDITLDFERVKAAPVREALFLELAALVGCEPSRLDTVPFVAFLDHVTPARDERPHRAANHRSRRQPRAYRQHSVR